MLSLQRYYAFNSKPAELFVGKACPIESYPLHEIGLILEVLGLSSKGEYIYSLFRNFLNLFLNI
jgi:hypothetical protein